MELVIKTGTKYQKIKLKDRKKRSLQSIGRRIKEEVHDCIGFDILRSLIGQENMHQHPPPPSPPPPPHQKKNGKAMLITNHDLFTHVSRTSGGLLVFTMTPCVIFPYRILEI